MGKEISLDLPPADSLFSTQEQRDDTKREKVYDIPLTEIDSFPGHPFRVVVDEEMLKMAESVKTYGVQTPGIAKRKENGRFELVSGHRRKLASELAGLETMPLIIRELTRDEAIIFMVDANLQREKILPSEKAFSYKMKLEAMKRQGQRNDLTCSPVGNKLAGLKSAEIIGDQSGESRNQIYRHIRLTELIPELLAMVDEGQIAFRPAVEISYLPETKQRALLETMQAEACTPSLTQAQKMKRFEEGGKLTSEVILSIMCEEKPNQAPQFKLPQERIAKFFPQSYTPKQMEETILHLLEGWQKQRERNDMAR